MGGAISVADEIIETFLSSVGGNEVGLSHDHSGGVCIFIEPDSKSSSYKNDNSFTRHQTGSSFARHQTERTPHVENSLSDTLASMHDVASSSFPFGGARAPAPDVKMRRIPFPVKM